MAVSRPKKAMSKEEIIEILRRNARLFKDEDDFVVYIVDLAMYLIENCLEDTIEKQPSKAPFKVSQEDMQNVYRVFDRFSTGKTSVSRTPAHDCPVCGAPVHGKRKCPECNSMTF